MPAINRVAGFTDTCDSIGAGWGNGPGDFGDLTATGGVFQPASADFPSMAGRSSGSYGPTQWCTATVATLAAGDNNVGVGVRWQGGANEACYFGDVYGDSGGYKYAIFEVDNAFGFTQLANAGTGGSVAGGVNITTETDADGSIRLYTDEGGTDTLRLSASDATLTGGTPCTILYGAGSASNSQITAIQGGTLWDDIGDFLVGVGPYTSGTGGITPQTIDGHAADDRLIVVAHSAGGENISLGTANGFSEMANSPSATGAGTAGVKVAAFDQVATGGAHSGPTITDPGNHCGGLILHIRHPDGAPTVNVTGNNQKASASTSFSISGGVTTVDGCLVLPISGRDTDSAAAAYSGVTNATLTALAELFDAGTASGNGGGLGIFAGIDTTAGTVDATTGTVASSINANYFLALAPYVAPSGGNRRRRFLMAA